MTRVTWPAQVANAEAKDKHLDKGLVGDDKLQVLRSGL